MPETPDPPAQLVVASGPFGTAAATVASAAETGIKLSKLTANQVNTLILLVMIFMILGLYTWGQFDSRNDRRNERETWAQADGQHLRSYEDGRERDRMTVERVAKQTQEVALSSAATLQEKALAASTQARKELLAHCTEEHEKNRKAMMELTAAIARLLKKPSEEICEPVVAPHPRAKFTGGIGLRSP